MTESSSKPKYSVELDILTIKKQLEQITDFALETRLTAVLSSHTLPFINFQFKRVLADAYATRNSLVDVEEQLAEKHSSIEDLMRERSRLSERVNFNAKYLESALRNYRTIADENITLTNRNSKLAKEIEAKQTIIDEVGEILKTIREIASKKKLPPDVLAELNMLLNEIPSPLPTAIPSETPTDETGDTNE
jgi:chromosome segregation ATPase